MSKILFLDDFLLHQVQGGAELNNNELVTLLTERGWDVEHKQSHSVNRGDIEHADYIIVSNFANLQSEFVNRIINSLKPYIIYEHDHKYLISRNPAAYKNFIAPASEIVNFQFYKNARSVVCQTRFHFDIVKSNLKLDNILNLGGNLWPVSILDSLASLSKIEKKDTHSIMDSRIDHKNTAGAIKFCKTKGLAYELIPNSPPPQFLKLLAKNKNFVFFPKTPETLSRVVVEARMLGCTVITNNLVGATGEPWFLKKGPELIEHFLDERSRIPGVIEGAF